MADQAAGSAAGPTNTHSFIPKEKNSTFLNYGIYCQWSLQQWNDLPKIRFQEKILGDFLSKSFIIDFVFVES